MKCRWCPKEGVTKKHPLCIECYRTFKLVHEIMTKKGSKKKK